MHDDDITVSPVDLSAEAVLELEELRQGVRTDAPAVHTLFRYIQTPAQTSEFQGHQSVSMLDDARAYALLRDSAPPINKKAKDVSEFRKLIVLYLKDLEDGVRAGDLVKISDAKHFCLLLNDGIATRQFREIYERREKIDQLYINNESIS